MTDGIDLTARDRDIVQRVLAPFADRIDRVAVFGSRVNGKARPASDIDLVIWGDLDAAFVAHLWSLFDASSLAVTVDVIAYADRLSPMIRHHIDTMARTLLTRDDLLAARLPTDTRG